MDKNTREELGMSSDMFVTAMPKGDTLVVGGKISANSENPQWTRVLSRHAAHLLWYRLTILLFPEKAKLVTALASTAPLRSNQSPTVTSHIEMVPTDDNYYDISGFMGNMTWWVKLSNFEARRLWAALDTILYPNGWDSKPTTTEKRYTPPPRRPQTYQ